MKNPILLFICLCFLANGNVYAQTGIIRTIAGTGAVGYSGDGGPASAATLDHPAGGVMDAAGNYFFAEYGSHVIRKITTSGIISTVVGTGTPGFSGDGGPATAAQLNTPYRLDIDVAGNLYIADCFNQRIRKVNTSGIISTVAGNGTPGFAGDGSAATLAELWNPVAVKVDATGNMYISDNQNQRIRKVNAAGMITTLAGTGSVGYSGDGGPATAAQLNYPGYVGMDATGNVCFSDGEYCIRKIAPSGVITTIAGTGTPGYSGDGGPATAALMKPDDLAFDAIGNLYFAEFNGQHVRKINVSGIVSTIAGDGTAGYFGDGGPATNAEINMPDGLFVDRAGRIWIADALNERIRVIGTQDRSPGFIDGSADTILICTTETPTAINSLLAVIDSDTAQALTWSTIISPTHGSLVAGYSTLSTGATVVPTGLNYQPFAGYLGNDVFSVQVYDGYTYDTITIYVTVSAFPDAGIISGRDSICPGSTTLLSETVTGGIWSTSDIAISTTAFSGTVTGIAPGRDTIIYTVINNCGIVSAIFPFTVLSYTACHTGVADVGQSNGNLLYPNPSYGQFTIKINSAVSAGSVVKITDVAGRLISHLTIATNKEETFFLDAAPGIYILSSDTGYERWSSKIVIMK